MPVVKFQSTSSSASKPVTCTTLEDAVKEIRENNGITSLPEECDVYDEFMQQGKILDIDVRCKYFIKDCLREGEKTKFDPKKIIKVYTHVLVDILLNSGRLDNYVSIHYIVYQFFFLGVCCLGMFC